MPLLPFSTATVLDADIGAIGALTGTGLLARTGTDTWALRTLTAGSASIVITNGSGASGNPTIDTAQNIQTTATPAFAGLTLDTTGLTILTGGNIVLQSGNITLSSTASSNALFFGSDYKIYHDGSNMNFLSIGTTANMLFKGGHFAYLGAAGATKLFIHSGSGTSFFTSDTNGTSAWQFRTQAGTSIFNVDSTNQRVRINAGADTAALKTAPLVTTDNAFMAKGIASQSAAIATFRDSADIHNLDILPSGGILLSAASGSNFFYVGSTSSGSVNNDFGFTVAGVGSTTASDGPYFVARGNSYTAIANQRGNIYFVAGTGFGTPNAAEGSINFNTGNTAVERISSGGFHGFAGQLTPVIELHQGTATTPSNMYSGGSGMILSHTSNFSVFIMDGATLASFVMRDAGAGTDLKNINLICDGGITKFRTLNDAASSAPFTNMLVFDHATGFSGHGTATPRRTVDILDSTNPQLRLTKTDNSVYTDMFTDANGNLNITPHAGGGSDSRIILVANPGVAPYFQFSGQGTLPAVITATGTDTGANAMLNFSCSTAVGGSIGTRPAFGINNAGNQIVTVDAAGRVFFGGATVPTAVVHLAAGSTTFAPLKFVSGTNLTSAAAGAMEFDGTKLYFSPSTTRKTIVLAPTSPSAYTPTNVTTDRAYDANATTLDELADVVGTLIADLQATFAIG